MVVEGTWGMDGEACRLTAGPPLLGADATAPALRRGVQPSPGSEVEGERAGLGPPPLGDSELRGAVVPRGAAHKNVHHIMLARQENMDKLRGGKEVT